MRCVTAELQQSACYIALGGVCSGSMYAIIPQMKDYRPSGAREKLGQATKVR